MAARMVKLAPSILSADFACLGEQVRQVEQAGADYLHVDVMDGAFVPNITMGPVIVEALRRSTSLPLDVHLMIEEPRRYVADFAQAGASILTIHQEADRHLQRTLTAIRERGLRAGLALNPGSPVSSIEDLGPDIDLLLVMTVNPGFGGQPFLSSLLHKVARARRWLDDHNLVAELEVDGGIKAENAARLVEAGAQVLVAGSSVFGKGSIAENLAALKRAATVASVI
jgi:ribulose-phosphate 3-epimerase